VVGGVERREEGSVITERNGRFGVRVYDPGIGHKRWVGTYATRREAKRAERDAGYRRGSAERVTCSEFADRWLVDHARRAAATRRTYGYAVKGFKEYFGKTRLAELDRVSARSWALTEPQSNVRAARAMLGDAINDGLHPGPNPFANLRLEQPRGRKDLDALTAAELDELADCALDVLGEFGPTFRAMIVFAGYVGLRPGELFALRRADIRGDEVTIAQNLDGTGQLKAPKNGRGRVVILPPPAKAALGDVPARIDVPWLFTTPRGRRFNKSSHLYYWNQVRAAFRRPGMDFYELRHFCATHLLELGVSHADVAVQLGHTDGGALVMSTYGHPSEDAARERLKRAYAANVTPLRSAEKRSQMGRRAG
jgi:integrase